MADGWLADYYTADVGCRPPLVRRAWLSTGGGSGSNGGSGGTAGKAGLRRAAVQTLGFVAEAEGGRFARRLPGLAPALVRLLQAQVRCGAPPPRPHLHHHHLAHMHDAACSS